MNRDKKKLVLILARNDRSYFGGLSRSGKAGFMRLALPTLAAMTPTDEWETEIIDARVTDINYDMAADLVGIGGFTSEIPSAYAIADKFRAAGKKVVLGGVHVSALPEEALDHADAVVIGEAEGVWDTLLEDFSRGEMKKTYKARDLPTLEHLALPRRNLIDRSMYGSGYNVLQATRGCPFDCEYCAVTVFYGHTFRTRPVAEVIDEIRGFDTKEFVFLDDNIAGKPPYAKELFKALIPLNKTWGGQTAITLARNDELMRLYAKSGGRYAFIGFESLSDKNLAKIQKSWNSPKGYREAIRKLHDAGINVVGSFIFGLDDDGPNVFKNTFDFIMETKIDAAMFNILTPFPGTRLYDSMEKEGRIIDHDWAKYHTGEVVVKPTGMTVEELQRGYWWIYKETNKTMNILKRCLRSPFGIPYRIGMNLSYRNKARKMPSVSDISTTEPLVPAEMHRETDRIKN